MIVGKGLSQRSDNYLIQDLAQKDNISSILKNRNANVGPIDDMNIGGKVAEKLTFRLPSAIKPVAYNLFLNPNLQTKTFQGNVKIDFIVSESVPFVALHSKFLNVTTNKLFKRLENGAEGIPIKSSFEYPKYEYFVVETENDLEAGNYTIDLDFDGRLDNKIVGFYSSSYYDKIKEQRR